MATLGWMVCLVGLGAPPAGGASPELWSSKPVVRPEVPRGLTGSPNPIDAFIAEGYAAQRVRPVEPADRATLLRRVSIDLTGLPPTIEEQEAFLNDPAPDAYEKVVDRLLSGEQHGVRYARHWLDVLRYADVDETMIAAPGIHYWRDWVIRALNEDVPFDQFVRAQLTGYRSTIRTSLTATGYRRRVEPRPDDLFALGLLARGAVLRDGEDHGELAIAAVETVSTAFMGLTVGCAKCHDHMYDPIKQADFYAMKALFDPLVVRKVTLATPAEIFAAGQARARTEAAQAEVEDAIERLVGPYRKRLYDERVAMLPDDVRAVILKPEKARNARERKIADDYFPVLRIDAGKIIEVLPEAERKAYQELRRRLPRGLGRRDSALPAFWTVEVDPRRELEKSYILTSGEVDRPEKNHEVQPGWPFATRPSEFPEGRVEAFADWLTAPDNPMLARVAVNRLWQWHFGTGLQKTPSDFGELGGTPSNPRLLDWLASEFVRVGFRMKAIHRLIVTSETYKLSTEVDPGRLASDGAADPENAALWHYPLRRLEAEPIWDSIQSAAGELDLTVGGPSFDPQGRGSGRRGADEARPAPRTGPIRRAAYIVRGYSTSRDVMPSFLQAFDVDDGRAPCPVRTRTIVAPQALFLMNSEPIDRAAGRFAGRLAETSRGDLAKAVELGYRIALTRPPTPAERARALAFLDGDRSRLKGFAWLLFNLDEFLFVR